MAALSRQLLQEESGLTLIELLVVMLVIAVLSSIAMPAFGDQVSKARDARAKQVAHAAEVTMETCGVESLSYADCNANALRALVPTLPDGPTLKVNNLDLSTYTIVLRSDPSSQKFKIKRAADGLLSFPCTQKGVGGCPGSGDWGGG